MDTTTHAAGGSPAGPRRGFPLDLGYMLQEVIRMRVRADAALRDITIVSRGLATAQRQIEDMMAREQ